MQKTRFQKWLHQRFQYQGIRTLKQNNVFVFIYQQGFLYLVLILITFIAGINYANNLILGFCFLISAILCISFYLTFKQLHALTIEVLVPEIGRVNDLLTVKIILKQKTKSPKYLNFKVDDQISPILFEELQQSFELNFIPLARGKYQIPVIQIFSTYPLGIVRSWTYLYLAHEIWIAPFPYQSSKVQQSSANNGLPDLDEFRELRSFKEGDSLQSISWKQAARGQGLYVKQFEDQTDAYSIRIDYAKMPSIEHEEKLSLMMGLVDECEKLQIRYALILPKAQTDFGVGELHYHVAKTLLAQA